MMWRTYLAQVTDVLAAMSVTDHGGEAITPDDAFTRWVCLAADLGQNGSIHLIGNGASASMASHFAADITKNCGLKADVFSDPALITALGNDNGFENIFAIALNRYGTAGDILVAISSSGNSPNIVQACCEAHRRGIRTITVSGMGKDNAIRSLGDLNFYVPAESYSLSESAHALILHHWTDRLERAHLARREVE